MSEPSVPPSGPPEHPEVRFEARDVRFVDILLVLVAAAILGFVLHVVIWAFFARVREDQARAKRSSFPLAEAPSDARPAGPRLEQIDRLDGNSSPNVYDREADKLKILNGYGPTEEEGFVRVPIAQAMRFLAGKLPARPEPSAEQKRRSGGLVGAGEPNAGRMFRRGAK